MADTVYTNTATRRCGGCRLGMCAWVLGVALCLLMMADARALSFEPTESEWLVWPPYCRARYVVSGAGVNSRFASRIPRPVVELFHRRYEGAWYGLHHYCAARIFLLRAQRAHSKDERLRLAQRVVDESTYTLARTVSGDPMRDEILLTMARAYQLAGKYADAVRVAQQAIKEHPANPKNYTGYAWVLSRQGRRDEAIAVLRKGNDRTGGRAAELNYVLGLLLLEVGKKEEAVAAAAVAYRRDYPLPGLKRKLQRAGLWDDVQRSIAQSEDSDAGTVGGAGS